MQSLCLEVLCSLADVAEYERRAGISSWKKSPSRAPKEQVAAFASGHNKALSSTQEGWQGSVFSLTGIPLQFAADRALSQVNILSDLIQPSYTSVKELLFCRCTSHLSFHPRVNSCVLF